MRCPECGEYFSQQSHNQIFCSSECGYQYRKKHKKSLTSLYPSVEFDCAYCGRKVVTEGGTKDKRTRFCSKECERKYWKHPPHEHESFRINFRSMDEFIQYEKYTNENF